MADNFQELLFGRFSSLESWAMFLPASSFSFYASNQSSPSAVFCRTALAITVGFFLWLAETWLSAENPFSPSCPHSVRPSSDNIMFKLSGKKKLIILQMSFQQSWQWYFIGWKYQTWFLSIHPGRMRTDWYSPLFSRDNATHALAHTETIQSQTCKVSEVLNCICWLLMRVFVFFLDGTARALLNFYWTERKTMTEKETNITTSLTQTIMHRLHWERTTMQAA